MNGRAQSQEGNIRKKEERDKISIVGEMKELRGR